MGAGGREIAAAATPAEARVLARPTASSSPPGYSRSGWPHRGQLPRLVESTVLPGTVSEGSKETYRRLLRL